MSEATNQDPESVKRLARLTGLLYLTIFVFGMGRSALRPIG